MKRLVLAGTAFASLSGGVQAQSSVTLFGVVDLNVRYVRNDAATWQLGQDGMAGSRLGFRGVEDLGSGLKAGFWLEAGLGPDTGRGNASFGNGTTSVTVPCPPGQTSGCPTVISNENAVLFQRRATVSLSNTWGELRLGRDYTPNFWSIAVYDPFSTNGVGSAGNLFIAAEIRGIVGAAGAYGTLVRANNSVQYILPNGIFGPGLYGNFMVAAGENAPANKYYGGRIGYAAGAFDAAAAYGYTYADAAGNVTAPHWNIGGSWNFGVAKLSGYYGSLQVDGLAAGDAKQDNWFVGITAPMAQWNLKASYGRVKQSGNVLDGNSASQAAIGVDYNVSLRTALYATASWLGNDHTTYGGSATGSARSRGNNSSGAEVGIRHSF